ncbi:hypothetical protein ACNKTV_002785 [Vibrio parahaemolyticus]
MKCKENALTNAVEWVGGPKAVANKVGCSDRAVRYIMNGDYSPLKIALKLSIASGVHVCELCPEYYPPEIFGDVPIEKITAYSIDREPQD